MIVVTSPTGQIGSQVLDRLLVVPLVEPVRVVVRDPDRLTPRVRGKVDVVIGSHGDAETVERALQGATALFWLVPPNPRSDSVDAAYSGFTKAVASVLPHSSVTHVINVSALGRGTPQAGSAGNVTASLAVDDLLADAAEAFRAVTCPSFMDNLLRQVPLIRDHGIITSPIPGTLQAPSCATRDIAATAAALLIDRSWSGSGETPVLGPRDLSLVDMAATISDVVGKQIEFQQVDGDTYRTRMMGVGMSAAMADAMLDMARAKSAGLDNAVRRSSDNTTSTTFRTWCEDTLEPAVSA